MRLVTGAKHEAAVAALQASYARIPAGQTVRLAKRTSNLFRPRKLLTTPGLDVAGLEGVLNIDRKARTADVQGMCTYERLVDETLRYGLMPYVVPQLKTITLGGAITGLGIESSSFRDGLPHESLLEADIMTGDGSIVTATPDNEHSDLFHAFPNSYGSLGYAVRLRIQLTPVRPYVGLRHIRFDNYDQAAEAISHIVDAHTWKGRHVDFLDGVVFGPEETYLTLGQWCDTTQEAGFPVASDYTGQKIYYQSIRQRSFDVLTVRDYLWRWDTDWFWCSRTFGAQNPWIRRIWPDRYRRSDVYHRLVSLENQFGVVAQIDRWRGKPQSERVIQDIEVPVGRLASFLRWFDGNISMSPVWLCPLKLRESRDVEAEKTSHEPEAAWPLYPLRSGETYVNVGFWGAVPMKPGARDGDLNRAIELAVSEHEGHKSLYSDAYYDEATFDELYGGAAYQRVKKRYDPEERLTGMYDKAVGRR